MSTSEFLELFTTLIFLIVAIRLIQIDLKVRRLPNLIVLPTTLCILILLVIKQYLLNDLGSLLPMLTFPLLIATAFFIIFLFYPSGLGMGDIKVILLIGITLCPIDISLFFFSLSISFVSGSIFALISRALGRTDKEFAFGPFLLLPPMAILSLQALL